MSDIRYYEPLWGSWYVDSIIGEGSFGKVYRVKKQEFDKTYYSAVKQITIPQNNQDLRQMQAEGMNLLSARDYFQALVTDIIREIDLMSEFRGNSNIVSFEDHHVIEHKDKLAWDILIRMELLTSLPDYVNEHPLQRSDVIKLGIHICRALELCAINKTIHRDIKPDNIFISRYGEFKLGDFGIARQIERTTSGLSKKGTYAFMAPEVFRGDEYGANVDIYSLGLVMYRLLNSGRLPFLPQYPVPITPSDRDISLQRRIKGEPIPPIAGLDAPLNAVILKACAFDRTTRFASAKEMRKALELVSTREFSETELMTDKTQLMTAPPNAQSTKDPAPSPPVQKSAPDRAYPNETEYIDTELSVKPSYPPAPSAPPPFEQRFPVSPIPVIPAGSSACERCGKPVPAGDDFCSRCGTPVAMSPAQPVVLPSAQPSAPKSGKGQLGLIIGLAAAFVTFITVLIIVIAMRPGSNYGKAVDLYNSGDYQQAYDAFIDLGNYKESAEYAELCQQYITYHSALDDMYNGDFLSAYDKFVSLGDFEDSEEKAEYCSNYIDYIDAMSLYDSGYYEAAYYAFLMLEDFLDSPEMAEKCLQPEPKCGFLSAGPAFEESTSGTLLRVYNQTRTAFMLRLFTTENVLWGSIWMTAFGTTPDISIPAATYMCDIVTGDHWFGPKEQFGTGKDVNVYSTSDYYFTMNSGRLFELVFN